MVVLGNLQTDEQLTTSTCPPTPSLHTIFVQAAIAAAASRCVFTFDFGQAFLNAQLNTVGSDDVILQLSKQTLYSFRSYDENELNRSSRFISSIAVLAMLI